MVDSGNVEWDLTEIGGQDAIRAAASGWSRRSIRQDRRSLELSEEGAERSTSSPRRSTRPFIGYRTDVFTAGHAAEELGRLVGREEIPRGRARCATIPTDNLEFALMADGVPTDKLYPIDFDRAFKKLDQIKPHVTVWWTTGQQPAQLLLDKEVVLATGWNGRFYDLIKKGAPIEIDWNEGALKQGSFVIPKGAKDPVLGATRCWPSMCDAASSRRSTPTSSAIPASTSNAQLRRCQGEAATCRRTRESRQAVLDQRSPGGPTTAKGAWNVERLDAEEGKRTPTLGGARSRAWPSASATSSALDGVSLAVARGELLTILGPSGSGKTTLLKVVAGFEIARRRPVTGRRRRHHRLPPAKRDIGMVFQNYALFPHMTRGAQRRVPAGDAQRAESRDRRAA